MHTYTYTYTHTHMLQVRIRDLPKMCVRNIVRLEADTPLFEVMRRFKAVRQTDRKTDRQTDG
jgi:hypothetical protein